jgi:hypothetical protein
MIFRTEAQSAKTRQWGPVSAKPHHSPPQLRKDNIPCDLSHLTRHPRSVLLWRCPTSKRLQLPSIYPSCPKQSRIFSNLARQSSNAAHLHAPAAVPGRVGPRSPPAAPESPCRPAWSASGASTGSGASTSPGSGCCCRRCRATATLQPHRGQQRHHYG